MYKIMCKTRTWLQPQTFKSVWSQ